MKSIVLAVSVENGAASAIVSSSSKMGAVEIQWRAEGPWSTARRKTLPDRQKLLSLRARCECGTQVMARAKIGGKWVYSDAVVVEY